MVTAASPEFFVFFLISNKCTAKGNCSFGAIEVQGFRIVPLALLSNWFVSYLVFPYANDVLSTAVNEHDYVSAIVSLGTLVIFARFCTVFV